MSILSALGLRNACGKHFRMDVSGDQYSSPPKATGWVAVHKEFTRDHTVLTTTVSPFDTEREAQAWCDDANKDYRFNYKPYPVQPEVRP